MSPDRIGVGIVGCGDVVHRHYLPALASMADLDTLVGVAGPWDGAGEAVAAAGAHWSPATEVFRDVAAMLRDMRLDAVHEGMTAPVMFRADLRLGSHRRQGPRGRREVRI